MIKVSLWNGETIEYPRPKRRRPWIETQSGIKPIFCSQVLNMKYMVLNIQHQRNHKHRTQHRVISASEKKYDKSISLVHEHVLHSLFIFRTQPYISMDYANKLWLKCSFSSHNNGRSVRSRFKTQQKNSMDCHTGNASYSFLTAFMTKNQTFSICWPSYHIMLETSIKLSATH